MHSPNSLMKPASPPQVQHDDAWRTGFEVEEDQLALAPAALHAFSKATTSSTFWCEDGLCAYFLLRLGPPELPLLRFCAALASCRRRRSASRRYRSSSSLCR